jgi:hypothetical protein
MSMYMHISRWYSHSHIVHAHLQAVVVCRDISAKSFSKEFYEFDWRIHAHIQALVVYGDLCSARTGLQLTDELHLLYVLTPLYVLTEPSWRLYWWVHVHQRMCVYVRVHGRYVCMRWRPCTCSWTCHEIFVSLCVFAKTVVSMLPWSLIVTHIYILWSLIMCVYLCICMISTERCAVVFMCLNAWMQSYWHAE